MWLWLQNGLKKHPLWVKLFTVSCLLHAAVLFLLLVAYRGYYAQYHLLMQPRANQPVIFMPLVKTVANDRSFPSRTSGRTEKLSPRTVETQSPTAKPITSPRTAITAEKPIKKQKARPEPSRRAKKQKPKKLTKKNKEVAKLAEKKPEQKIESAPVEQPETCPELSRRADVPPVAADTQQLDSIYIGQVEREVLQLQEAIEEQLAQHWKPPAGFAADLVCQVKVIIDLQGLVQEVAIHESSRVLAYDVHARRAVCAMAFPKLAWGKELILHFTQGAV